MVVVVVVVVVVLWLVVVVGALVDLVCGGVSTVVSSSCWKRNEAICGSEGGSLSYNKTHLPIV